MMHGVGWGDHIVRCAWYLSKTTSEGTPIVELHAPGSTASMDGGMVTPKAHVGVIVGLIEHVLKIPRGRLPGKETGVSLRNKHAKLTPSKNVFLIGSREYEDIPASGLRKARSKLAALDLGEVYRVLWTLFYWSTGIDGCPETAELFTFMGWDPRDNYKKKVYNTSLNMGYPDTICLM